MTWQYIEMILPDYDVRHIAINDGVDTLRSENEMMAFKNVFNDWIISLENIFYAWFLKRSSQAFVLHGFT